MEEIIGKLPSQSLFLVCLLLHFIADFNLQGMLGNLKQKKWWKENYPSPLYKYDYITSGIIHAVYWGILTFLPFVLKPWFCYVVLINGLIHYTIDHFKANRLSISLMADQMLHIVQIGVTVQGIVILT
ncbi:MAG: DUF3307 domain-containing protein [Prevotella sp.]|nr:DUF3307 domain-containing protein [Prevotella sp.]